MGLGHSLAATFQWHAHVRLGLIFLFFFQYKIVSSLLDIYMTFSACTNLLIHFVLNVWQSETLASEAHLKGYVSSKNVKYQIWEGKTSPVLSNQPLPTPKLFHLSNVILPVFVGDNLAWKALWASWNEHFDIQVDVCFHVFHIFVYLCEKCIAVFASQVN